jgi:uncharacterized protein (DUF1697 family)
MGRYAAFLRGINLGRRRVTGAQLRAPLVALGFDDVASFLASGNLAFTADDPAEELEPRLEACLEAGLGFPADVHVRTADEVGAVVAATPFPPGVLAAGGKLQVAFLRSAPSAAAAATALALAPDEDRLALQGRELYWLPQGGVSDSALDLAALERMLGPMTMRTASTVTRLFDRHLA